MTDEQHLIENMLHARDMSTGHLRKLLTQGADAIKQTSAMNPSDALREALEEARRTIKANRAVMMMRQGASVEQDWEIYERCSPEMRKIDAALAAPVSVADVIEPTEAMIEAGREALTHELHSGRLNSVTRGVAVIAVYRAMQVAALRSQVVGV